MFRADVRASGGTIGGNGGVGVTPYFCAIIRLNPAMQQLTILQALQQARRDIDDTDARMLLQSVLDVSHAHLIAYCEHELTPEQAQSFRLLTIRRMHGEPVAYLMGKREFYGLDFKVTPAVLIPRPETELLVDLALKRIPLDRPCKILDLGTGSGAIALTLARHRPLADIVAVDSSADAVVVAKINAEQFNVNNVRIIETDWFEGLSGERFDLIVSNPPYVACGDPHLTRGDLRFEPRMALTEGAGGDGLGEPVTGEQVRVRLDPLLREEAALIGVGDAVVGRGDEERGGGGVLRRRADRDDRGHPQRDRDGERRHPPVLAGNADVVAQIHADLP